MRLGGHLPARDPLRRADELGFDAIQIHVSSPRTWQGPRPHPDAALLAASGRVVAVHAPYLCNPTSADQTVRERTEVLLQATIDAATTIGAGAVVVHAGQAGGDGTIDVAIERWMQLLPRLRGDTPLLVENTASGQVSVGRRLEGIAALFDAFRRRQTPMRIGACLDTAHAFAADPAVAADPAGWVRCFVEATGGVDLLHVNDSLAPPGSGRDRHANLGAGVMGLPALAEMIAASRAPAAILETPGHDERRAQDLEILRYLVATGDRAPVASDRDG